MPDPVLVVIFLRGGADALSLLSPTADPDYIAARPETLRVRRDGDRPGHVLGEGLADADFRLHPVAKDLPELYRAGDLSFVHATGLIEATRSHFDAEARIERSAGSGSAGGWLGRWLTHAAPVGPLPALAVGTALPESLRGGRAMVAPDLADLMLAAGHWLSPALHARLAEGFGDHPSLGPTVSDLLDFSGLLEDRFWIAETAEMRPYVPAAQYPQHRLYRCLSHPPASPAPTPRRVAQSGPAR